MNPLSVGDPLRLGPYRLLGVLGEGGMGKVYAGKDDSGTIAAVKVLHPELAGEQNLAQRFVREAHAAQAVTSPGVARVLGAQTEGGRPWIATEFLAGPTLAQAVEEHGPFGDATLRSLAASIAATLVDVHAAGLIHRDLKPQNIVLTSDGPRVIDFGIARPEHGLTLTTTGQIPVTPGYGAPEQVLGRRVASTADVFSLGAVLAYAASGTRAFDGANVAVLQYEVVHGEPRLDGVPGPLRTLIQPCLAKDPAARPTPAKIMTDFAPPRGAERVWRRGGLAADIKARERDVRGMSTLVPRAEGPRLPLTRRQLLRGGVTAGVVALAAGGGATAWWLGGRSTENNLFSVAPPVDTPEADLLSAADGDYTAGTPPKPLWKRERVLALDSATVLPVRDVVVFGGVEGGLVAHSVVNGKRRWAAEEVRRTGLFLSLSDALIAAVDDRGIVRTYVASTGEPKWTSDAGADALLAADEEKVYVVTKDGELRSVRLYDARTDWTAALPRPFRGKKLHPSGVAGRGRLVVSTGDGDILAVDTDDGSKAWEIRGQFNGPVHPARWRDTVYVNGGSLTARSLVDGKERWTRKEPGPGGTGQTWGPPIVTSDALYATHGTTPRRLNPSDGGEVWDARTKSMIRSPLALQGRTLWSVGEKGAGSVSAVGAERGLTVWNSPLPGARRPRRIVGDGNRVFVMNDYALYALPVA